MDGGRADNGPRQDVRRTYDHIADRYVGWYRDPRDLAEDAVSLRWMRWAAGDRNRVLDVGCGAGWSSLAADPTADYLGIDVSPRMVELAREAYPTRRFEVADMEQLGGLGIFGAIVSAYGAFCYARDPERCAQGFFDSLEVGGRVCALLYGPATEWSQAYVYRDEAGVPLRRTCYRAQEVRELFARAGFRYVRVRGLTSTRAVRALSPWGGRPSGLLARAVVELDAATVGLADPDRCHFLAVTGSK